MWRNYFIVSWRNIKKHKAFTAINVVGLSLSMSVCLLLILLVYDHYSYDTVHPYGDRTYRVLTYHKGARGIFSNGYATSPLPIGEALSNGYTLADAYTNLNHGLHGEIRSAHKVINPESEFDGRSLFADHNFFKVFGFDLKEGDPLTALNEPYSMVLTSQMANLLFPQRNALGEEVIMEGMGRYKVTGILTEELPKSHIKFKLLASFSTIPLLANENHITDEYKKWETIWMNYNYIVLNEEASKAEAQALINQIASEQMKLKDDHPGYEFELQGMSEIVPGRLLGNEISFTLPKIVLLFFGLLGLVVIITASINYANLSIAKSLTRTREVGIRKANGASKAQIIIQFLVESVLISTLSLVVAIGIYWFLIDQFNALWIFNQVGITLEDTVFAYGFFLLFSLLLGIISGVGPSYFVSRLDTIRSLKGSGAFSNTLKSGFFSKISGKKILLSVQFGLSIVMLVSIFLIRDQANFLTRSSFGFDDEHIYFVRLQGHDPKVIETEFANTPGIENVTFTSHHPAVGRSHGANMKLNEADEFITIYHFSVEERYVSVMGLELIAGTDFPRAANQEQEKFIVVNELATKRLGFESPAAAVGELVYIENDTRVKIVGVVRDYHWEPLMKSIEPLALRIKPEDYQFAYFKIAVNDPGAFGKGIEQKWNQYDQTRNFQGGFLNEETDLFYQFFYDLGGILTFISLIAIAITALGFLGMVSFHLKTRTKEIGIRKVLGASFGQITLAMTGGFMVMLAATALVMVPVAVFANGLWINQMAVHSPISIFNVGPAILIVVLLSGATILSQVWRNTSENPVNALRSE